MSMLPVIPEMDLDFRPFRHRHDFWSGVFDHPIIPTSNNNTIKMDLVETDHSFVVTAQVPGVKKQDIKVMFEHDVLTVVVNRSNEQDITKGRVHFKECSTASSSRSISFKPGKIDQNNISAKYQHGQLSIELNFTNESDMKKPVDIEIN